MPKVGRPKNIETPETMWKHFQEYMKDVKSKPVMVTEQRKGAVNIRITKGVELSPEMKEKIEEARHNLVVLTREKPLTFIGFENWLFCNDIISDVSDYFENKEDRYKEFIPICQRIKKMITEDQVVGGMTNIYNPSITQRLNGLADKKEVEQTNILKQFAIKGITIGNDTED